jgi:hypothetical protein
MVWFTTFLMKRSVTKLCIRNSAGGQAGAALADWKWQLSLSMSVNLKIGRKNSKREVHRLRDTLDNFTVSGSANGFICRVVADVCQHQPANQHASRLPYAEPPA